MGGKSKSTLTVLREAAVEVFPAPISMGEEELGVTGHLGRDIMNLWWEGDKLTE